MSFDSSSEQQSGSRLTPGIKVHTESRLVACIAAVRPNFGFFGAPWLLSKPNVGVAQVLLLLLLPLGVALGRVGCPTGGLVRVGFSRAPSDHMNTGILKTMVPGISLSWAPDPEWGDP